MQFVGWNTGVVSRQSKKLAAGSGSVAARPPRLHAPRRGLGRSRYRLRDGRRFRSFCRNVAGLLLDHRFCRHSIRQVHRYHACQYQACRQRGNPHPAHQPAPRMMPSKGRSQTCPNFSRRALSRRGSQSAQRDAQSGVCVLAFS
jgi:hypothetical protein